MSENVEIVRRAYAALNRGDEEAIAGLCHPDVELIPLRVDATGPFHGHAGMRAFFRDNAETFESFEVEPREIRDLGGDRVLALGTVKVRARGSDAPIEQHSAVVFWLREGRATRIEDFHEEERALAGAGVQ